MTLPNLQPLAIQCTSTDCENELHCFRQTVKKGTSQTRYGQCIACGQNLVQWDRVHHRDLADVDYTFNAMKMEVVRHHFWHVEIAQRAINYALRKGRIGLRAAAQKRIRDALGAVSPPFDGRQTPKEGSDNPLHYAQHATATCCRKCVEEWHGIPLGRELTEDEIRYLAALVCRYVDERIAGITEDRQKIPPLRRR